MKKLGTKIFLWLLGMITSISLAYMIVYIFTVLVIPWMIEEPERLLWVTGGTCYFILMGIFGQFLWENVSDFVDGGN